MKEVYDSTDHKQKLSIFGCYTNLLVVQRFDFARHMQKKDKIIELWGRWRQLEQCIAYYWSGILWSFRYNPVDRYLLAKMDLYHWILQMTEVYEHPNRKTYLKVKTSLTSYFCNKKMVHHQLLMIRTYPTCSHRWNL